MCGIHWVWRRMQMLVKFVLTTNSTTTKKPSRQAIYDERAGGCVPRNRIVIINLINEFQVNYSRFPQSRNTVPTAPQVRIPGKQFTNRLMHKTNIPKNRIKSNTNFIYVLLLAFLIYGFCCCCWLCEHTKSKNENKNMLLLPIGGLERARQCSLCDAGSSRCHRARVINSIEFVTFRENSVAHSIRRAGQSAYCHYRPFELWPIDNAVFIRPAIP